ncbi:uncharacterized protein V1516DRAFT_675933 [Lipomyces oligophaga]|uniref:uncharacterized protein n=1 Tax=Lipomyces oligophaga TaxID=45792 RepID=UPI0034CFBAD4
MYKKKMMGFSSTGNLVSECCRPMVIGTWISRFQRVSARQKMPSRLRADREIRIFVQKRHLLTSGYLYAEAERTNQLKPDMSTMEFLTTFRDKPNSELLSSSATAKIETKLMSGTSTAESEEKQEILTSDSEPAIKVVGVLDKARKKLSNALPQSRQELLERLSIEEHTRQSNKYSAHIFKDRSSFHDTVPRSGLNRISDTEKSLSRINRHQTLDAYDNTNASYFEYNESLDKLVGRSNLFLEKSSSANNNLTDLVISRQTLLSMLRTSDGVFDVSLLGDSSASESISSIGRWRLERRFDIANLSVAFFRSQIMTELKRIGPSASRSKVIERLLPIFIRARDNPSSYDLIKYFIEWNEVTVAMQCLSHLFKVFPDEDSLDLVLNGFRNVLYVAEPRDLLDLFKRLIQTEEIISVASSLVPQFAAKDPYNWLLAEFHQAIRESNSDRVLGMLTIVLCMIAVKHGSVQSVADLLRRLLEGLPRTSENPSQALDVYISSVLFRTIVNKLISLASASKLPADLVSICRLWSQAQKYGIGFTSQQIVEYLELFLSVIPPEGGLNIAHYAEPSKALNMLLEANKRELQIPQLYYQEIIRKYLANGDCIGAVRHFETLIKYPGVTINNVSPVLVAELIHSLSKESMYEIAWNVISQINYSMINSQEIIAALLNYCARSRNVSFANQVMELITLPLSRPIMKQLLLLSTRLADHAGVKMIVGMIEKDQQNGEPLSPAEFSILLSHRCRSEGYQSGKESLFEYSQLHSSPSVFAGGWNVLLGYALWNKDFESASIGFKYATRDARYVKNLIRFIATCFGPNNARLAVQQLTLQRVETGSFNIPLGHRSYPKQPKLSDNLISKFLYQADGKVDYSDTGISSRWFLPETEYHSIIGKRMTVIHNAFTLDVDDPPTEACPFTIKGFHLSIFDNAPLTFTPIFELIRLALNSNDTVSYNWSIVLLSFLGMSPTDLEAYLESIWKSTKRASSYKMFSSNNQHRFEEY